MSSVFKLTSSPPPPLSISWRMGVRERSISTPTTFAHYSGYSVINSKVQLLDDFRVFVKPTQLRLNRHYIIYYGKRRTLHKHLIVRLSISCHYPMNRYYGMYMRYNYCIYTTSIMLHYLRYSVCIYWCIFNINYTINDHYTYSCLCIELLRIYKVIILILITYIVQLEH